MESKKLGQLLLDGLLITQENRLVAQNISHICLEHVYVLADGDLMLLGLILKGIKSSSELMDLVLYRGSGTERRLLAGKWWWWRGNGGGLFNLPRGIVPYPKPSLVCSELFLVQGLVA